MFLSTRYEKVTSKATYVLSKHGNIWTLTRFPVKNNTTIEASIFTENGWQNMMFPFSDVKKFESASAAVSTLSEIFD